MSKAVAGATKGATRGLMGKSSSGVKVRARGEVRAEGGSGRGAGGGQGVSGPPRGVQGQASKAQGSTRGVKLWSTIVRGRGGGGGGGGGAWATDAASAGEPALPSDNLCCRSACPALAAGCSCCAGCGSARCRLSSAAWATDGARCAAVAAGCSCCAGCGSACCRLSSVAWGPDVASPR